MDAASSRLKRACGIHMKWEQVFEPVIMKIDRKYANVWLGGLPDLSVECSVTKVSELLGEKIKRLAKNFPLKSSGSRISRVFLRQDLINLWNALVDEENTNELNILSAASGLGKSIYLYLIAVFARHFGIPVQYIGNTGDLLRDRSNEELEASNNFAALLLFMNLKILDELGPFHSCGPDYEHLRGLPMEHAIFYAHQKGDLLLCGELRRNFMNMAQRNFLIVDEHNALWQKFGSDTKTWLSFFEFYADPVGHATRYCKFVIATSQLHQFKLPSGYVFSIQYVKPLSREEFEIWERLDDYPKIFRDNESTVVDLTGFVPGMIAELIGEYVKSLTHEVDKKQFYDGLHKLFRGRETSAITLFDSAYRDRGLLIAMNDGSLQFYNSIACDILYESFSNYYVTKERILELSKRFKECQMADADGGEF
ncbi:hypothetical protein GAYE_SCF31G4941 [Galdieria yellowstonensis]|uniref:AAA+ ATPase domain-containing protein n=1 Tax=Galdieria yellowstonensis TaxID=3028027 RepID=A0AAV9IHT5_9RHOD|nr:hypothetical protein GAYE_SCF31G4941 [Galdieria yellowstonensis]